MIVKPRSLQGKEVKKEKTRITNGGMSFILAFLVECVLVLRVHVKEILKLNFDGYGESL